MSEILNTNVFDEAINDVLSVAITVSSGTITDDTDKDKLLNRNIADAYEFTASATGTMTIAVTSNQFSSISSIGLLGATSTLSISALKSGSGTPSTTITVLETIERNRSNITSPLNSALKDTIKTFASQGTLATFYIEIGVSAGGSYKIGTLWGSRSFQCKITPTGGGFNPTDTTDSDISNGGQKYVNAGVTLDDYKFNIPTLTQSQAKGNSDSIEYINNSMATAHPLIVIPFFSDNMMLYGTQKTLAKLTPIDKRDGDGWYWKASMHVTEEL